MRINIALATALLASSCLVPACGGGGGGGGGGGNPVVFGFVTNPEIEANNAFGTATPLPLGQAGTGSLAVIGDEDYWSFTVAAAGYVRIQIFGVRFDQASWEAAFNAPVITLFAPDGVTRIAEQDINADVFPSAGLGGSFDRDFDCVRLDAAGTYYVRVAADIPANAGATYAVAVSDVTLAGIQLEAEAEGVMGVNDTTATAEPMAVGVMQGSLVAGEDDVYAITVVAAPSIIQAEIKGYRLGGSGAAATDMRAFTLQLIAPDGATLLGSLTDGYNNDPLMSFAVTAPGTYYLRVEPQGAPNIGRYQLHYDLRAVGAISEAEGNNTTGAANALAGGQFIQASTGAGDVDFFSFAGLAGEMRAIRVWANGNHDMSPEEVTTEIFAPDGVTMVPSITSAGGMGYLRERRFILQQSGTHYVRVTPNAAPASNYIIRNVLNKATGVENEPNDVMGGANALDAAGRAAGVILVGGDVDWYGFAAAAGELVTIQCFARPTAPAFLDRLRNGYGSVLAPVLTAIDSGGATVATSVHTPPTGRKAHGSTGRGPTVEVSFRAPAAGTYFVRVGAEAGDFGADRYYMLERK